METWRLEVGGEKRLKALRRGWCLGSRAFKNRMLEQEVEGKPGEHHSGKLRLETAEARAERILAEDLGKLGWKETELGMRRKSDPAKLAMAAHLRRETTLSIRAIAARLHLGTWRSANIRLHAAMKGTTPAEPHPGGLGS